MKEEEKIQFYSSEVPEKEVNSGFLLSCLPAKAGVSFWFYHI